MAPPTRDAVCIPEIQAGTACFNQAYVPPGCNTGPWLRDRFTNARYQISHDNLSMGSIARYFPIKTPDRNGFVAIAVQEAGDVEALHMIRSGDQLQVATRVPV